MRKYLKFIFTFVAVRFRFGIFFKIMRFFQNHKLLANITSRIIEFFDPNNLRRKTSSKIKKTKVLETGVYGETLMLDLAEHIEYRTFFQGFFDLVAPEVIKKLGKNHGVQFFDIGANVGIISLAVAKLGVEVHAFEPVPKNIEALRCNFSLNPGLVVTVWPIALVSNSESDHSDFIDLFIPEGNSGATSSMLEWNLGKSAPRKIRVQTSTLDDLIFRNLAKNLTGLLVIKIDVEGMEHSVLCGATRVIESLKPFIILEWRPDRLSDFKKEILRNFLIKNLDYDIMKVSFDFTTKRLLWSEVDWLSSSENLVFFPRAMREILIN